MRPDDIPEDAWDAAEVRVNEMARNIRDDCQCVDCRSIRVEAFARAILAERERCAKVAEEGVKWTPEPPKEAAFYVRETPLCIARAIRNG